MRGSAWLPLQEAHAGTSQQERLGSPKSPGGGAAGSRGGEQAAAAPGPRQALPSSPEGSQAARDSCELSRRRDLLTHREAPREGPVLERGAALSRQWSSTGEQGQQGVAAQPGSAKGPVAPASAGLCGRVAGRRGVGGGAPGAGRGQGRRPTRQGGDEGVQGRPGEQGGSWGEVRRQAGGGQLRRARSPFRTAPPQTSSVSELQGTPHLDEFHGPARWGKRAQRPQGQCPSPLLEPPPGPGATHTSSAAPGRSLSTRPARSRRRSGTCNSGGRGRARPSHHHPAEWVPSRPGSVPAIMWSQQRTRSGRPQPRAALVRAGG